MRRVPRGRSILALAAWLLPLAGTAATGLHLSFEDHHLPDPVDATDPASIRGPEHTHEAPDQAPAIATDAAPRSRPSQGPPLAVVSFAAVTPARFDERHGLAGRAGPGPDPPHLGASHSILRI